MNYTTKIFSDTFIVCKDNYDGQINVTTYGNSEQMFRDVSKLICFSDCDDCTEILQIVYNGREVKYGGWKQGMHYTFYTKDTNELVWEAWYPEWDH